MRISHDDQLFALLREQGRSVEIWLDGIKQSNVIRADEATGELVRYRTDASGKLVTLYSEVLRDTLKGKVRIDIVRADGGR